MNAPFGRLLPDQSAEDGDGRPLFEVPALDGGGGANSTSLFPFRIMSDEFTEAIVCLVSLQDRREVSDWFARRGLSVLPMRAGMLINGSRTVLFRALGATDQLGLRELPVPEVLRAKVSSITLSPKYPHS